MTDAPFEDHEIPIDNTEYEELVISILKEAADKVAALPMGTGVDVTVPDEKLPDSENLMLIVGPVMFRAHEYGLNPVHCVDWTFSFAKFAENPNNPSLA